MAILPPAFRCRIHKFSPTDLINLAHLPGHIVHTRVRFGSLNGAIARDGKVNPEYKDLEDDGSSSNGLPSKALSVPLLDLISYI